MRRTSPAHQRVAIFVDFDNLAGKRARRFGVDRNKATKEWVRPPGMSDDKFHRIQKVPMDLWEVFNARMLALLKQTSHGIGEIRHAGTWLAVGRKLKPTDGDRRFFRRLQIIDQVQAFMMRYGIKIVVRRFVKETSRYEVAHEDRGVDSALVCQMLIGAMHNEYDICILCSDDKDFIPAVALIQNRYGKRVYQAGYLEAGDLRAAAYGHLKLERRNPSFQ